MRTDKLFATCTPPSAKDLEDKARIDASDQQVQQQDVAEQQQDRERIQAQAAGQTTDPGTLAMRKCAEAGRDLTQCFGEVMGGSVQQVTGNGMPGTLLPRS